MKEILIILDGLMEEKLEGYSFKELLLGNLDIKFKEEMKDFSVKGKDIDSLNCIMNILGYPADKVHIGERAFYEGLNRGIIIKENQSILRCNIVKINKGILEDFTGGNLVENIRDVLKDFNIEDGRLYPCYKYKNLLVLNTMLDVELYPPHFHIGEEVKGLIPKDKLINKIIMDSYKFFKERDMEGCMFWPWGISKEILLEPYSRKAGVITGIDLVAGIGKALGMKVIQPKGATGDYNTNLKGKLIGVFQLMNEAEQLIVHINALDELAHRKDFKGKLDYIKIIRKEFLVPLLSKVKDEKDWEVKITCDHRTDSFTGRHEEGKVPFMNIFN
ncbi:hypothetical protein ACQPU1_05590 [Clostridium paraputrificum]|uniref:hypothetical protein n=1 Tax=Clostridium paraputrificum TaxID=29363 RepID=UPI003D34EB14